MKRKAGDGPVQALLLGVIEGITEFTAVTQTGGQRDEQRLTLGDGLLWRSSVAPGSTPAGLSEGVSQHLFGAAVGRADQESRSLPSTNRTLNPARAGPTVTPAPRPG